MRAIPLSEKGFSNKWRNFFIFKSKTGCERARRAVRRFNCQPKAPCARSQQRHLFYGALLPSPALIHESFLAVADLFVKRLLADGLISSPPSFRKQVASSSHSSTRRQVRIEEHYRARNDCESWGLGLHTFDLGSAQPAASNPIRIQWRRLSQAHSGVGSAAGVPCPRTDTSHS